MFQPFFAKNISNGKNYEQKKFIRLESRPSTSVNVVNKTVKLGGI